MAITLFAPNVDQYNRAVDICILHFGVNHEYPLWDPQKTEHERNQMASNRLCALWWCKMVSLQDNFSSNKLCHSLPLSQELKPAVCCKNRFPTLQQLSRFPTSQLDAIFMKHF